MSGHFGLSGRTGSRGREWLVGVHPRGSCIFLLSPLSSAVFPFSKVPSQALLVLS